jgi:hypothetical protein
LSWDNPHPETPITSIDIEGLESPASGASPEVILLVGITAQAEPDPIITRHPQMQAADEGANILFRVDAESEEPLAYQWQFNGAEIPGATNATLSIKRATPSHAGAYNALVRNAVQDSVLILTSESAPLVIHAGRFSYGALRREMYLDLKETSYIDLTNDVRFAVSPDERDFLYQFENPENAGNDFGVRLSGYLAPSKTGDYRFYLSSNGEGVLFLSRNESPEHKRRIAHEPKKNASRLWTASANRPKKENISAPIFLEAGRHYYIEALMKEDTGRDCLAVTWQLPDEPVPQNLSPPIAGTYLATSDEWRTSQKPFSPPPGKNSEEP